MKICIVSTAALPAPPIGYGGLEHIAYDSAVELAKLGNEVTLITTDGSTKLGVQEAVIDNQIIGKLTVVSAGPSTWNYTGERDMFLNYVQFLSKEFGEGQGVVIDHSWWGYPYFLLTGGEISERRIKILPHPKMKMLHVIHGVTGWRKGSDYSPPPGVKYPRIMGVSRSHALYLSSCFKLPTRYVFNGVKTPEDGLLNVSRDTYLLSLNRISREKGIHNAIDVCLSTKTPLKIVGDDEKVSDQKYVFDIMDSCSRSGGLVEYVGTVNNDRKWEYIRNCRGLIACPDPSSYVESFYMAAVEGWSVGKPILSLANGGLSDIVLDGVNGFLASSPGEMKEILVKGKEVYGLATGMKDLYRKVSLKLEDLDPEKIKAEASKYTVENMAKGYLEICKGIESNDPSFNW